MKRPKSHYKISVVESPNAYIVFKKRTPLCRPQHPYDGKWNASMKPTCEECRRRLKKQKEYDFLGYSFNTQTTFAF
jgi:hypothetical protein